MTQSTSRLRATGIWHLGAAASPCLADFGYEVIGVDNDDKRVEGSNT